jgi:3-phenylpropionate/trans-cinnamate dioxygenase ferredoxin subunit
MLYTWTEIDQQLIYSLEEEKITEIAIGEKKLCVLKRGDQLFAFAATCPHQGARLCEGWLDAQGRIVCHLHKYRFDPANGRNTSGEGYKLRTYPVAIRDGKIFIGL